MCVCMCACVPAPIEQNRPLLTATITIIYPPTSSEPTQASSTGNVGRQLHTTPLSTDIQSVCPYMYNMYVCVFIHRQVCVIYSMYVFVVQYMNGACMYLWFGSNEMKQDLCLSMSVRCDLHF